MRLYSPMPELIGATKWLNGEVKRSQLVGGKPTLFHFWSVSCTLCKVTIEDVHEICNDYKGRLNVVSVHMPLSENDKDLTTIEKVAKRLGISHPIFIDNALTLSTEFNNLYVPSYYLFDRLGVFRHYQAGKSSMGLLRNRLDRILE